MPNPLIHPKIKVVLFDHDDTLVGTIEPKWAHHKHVSRTYYDKELTDDVIREHWGKPFSVLVGLLYGTDDIEQAKAYNRACHEDFPKVLHKDTLETLRHLEESGKLLGIMTATTRHSLTYDLQTLGITEKLFSYIQTEEDTAFHKPDPRVFEPTLSWLKSEGISPAEVVYIGDGLHDMKAAMGAGFEFVGVGTGLVTQKDFADIGVKAVRQLGDLITRDPS